MITSDKQVVQLIVEQCIVNGMKHIVCSPGSRNAPLVIAFDEHPEIECLVIHDERSAAFFALGMAQQYNSPVGVVCTSGSAAANYYPAIVEAYYQCLPLVVITADRPKAWIDQGDGQTIVQQEIFGQHVRYACNFNERMDDPEGLWYVAREMAIGFSQATKEWKGPLHINVGLNEPLYETIEKGTIGTRIIELERGLFQFSTDQQKNIIEALRLPKKLILCGQHVVDERLLQQLKLFANDTSVAILVENTANLQDMRFVHCIDRTLNTISEKELEDFAPDLLITIGGAVISKRVKGFLRKHKPSQHWKIGFEFPYMDTYQSLTHSFQVSAADFFTQLNLVDFPKNGSNYGSKWKQRDFLVQDKIPTFFQSLDYSDLKVFETILDYIPDGAHVHMANSSVIRYCQLFDPINTMRYWSNRGTSGIDGSSSTAAGAAYALKNKLHVLLTGDVSFFYDSNALWNKYLGSNLRIILINNNGGGIFRIIPGPSSTPQLNKYFEAQHTQEAGEICKAFDVAYFKAKNMVEVETVMEEFYRYDEDGRPKLLEISTPSEINDNCLNQFFAALK